MYDAPARIGALCSFAALLGASTTALADQVVVTDVTYTHSNETTEESHYRVAPRQGTPANWMSPVDYTKGSVHILVDVKTKPGNTPTKFQICFEGDPNYACTDQSPTYTGTGKQEWVSPFSRFWYSGDLDWSQGIERVALILKDTDNMPRTEAAYLPTDLRVEVTLLSEGETYEPGGGSGDAGAPAPRAGSGGDAAGSDAAGSGGRGGSAGPAPAGEGGSDGAAGAPPPGDEGQPAGAAGADGAAAGAGGAAGPGGAAGAGASGGAAGARGGAGAPASAPAGATSTRTGGTGGGTSARSDADTADDDFQYPSGNENNCAVAHVGPSRGGLGIAFGLLFACAAFVQRRRR